MSRGSVHAGSEKHFASSHARDLHPTFANSFNTPQEIMFLNHFAI